MESIKTEIKKALELVKVRIRTELEKAPPAEELTKKKGVENEELKCLFQQIKTDTGKRVKRDTDDKGNLEHDVEVKNLMAEKPVDDSLNTTSKLTSDCRISELSSCETNKYTSSGNMEAQGKDGDEYLSALPTNINKDLAGEWVCDVMLKILNSAVFLEGRQKALQGDVILAHSLLDYTWQQLNIGHWRDVPLTWRYIYTWGSIGLVGILLAKLGMREEDTSTDEAVFCAFCKAALEVVQACDKGLLMGAPVENNPLHKVAMAFNIYARKAKEVNDENIEAMDSEAASLPDSSMLVNPLPIISQPPLDRFLLQYKNPAKPVKLLGIIDHWPALKLWNIAYLRQTAGARTIPVEIGARYTDDSWAQELMTLDDYITQYITNPSAGTPTGYLAQHQLLDQVPELNEDLITPDYCHLGEEAPRLHAWIGPCGTVSPLHYDPDHNILVQVVGYKYIRLYEEDQSEYLYPHPDPLLNNTSQVDVEGPEDPSKPLFQKAQFQDLILGPGEAVYIPPRCWHYVRSLSISISVSFWWM